MPKKEVATTLKNVLENSVFLNVNDLSVNPDIFISEITSWWEKDIYTRKPSPIEFSDDGNLIPTKLDLSTVIYTLCDRQAIINIPLYEAIRNNTKKDKDFVVSKENRHGELIGLTSNKKTFNFGIKIKDYNVIKNNEVGSYRTFLMTDHDGNWYSGWEDFEFQPSEKEKQYIAENKISFDDNIVFDNFITPEKWISFYGYKYWVTKVCIDRLSYQISETNKIISTIKQFVKFAHINDGIFENNFENESDNENSETSENISKDVECFEAECDYPDFKNKIEFQEITDETPILKANEYYLKLMSSVKFYKRVLTKLRYATRCVEYSAYKMNPLNHFPVWLTNCKWDTDFKFPRKRTIWNRLIFGQEKVGQYGYGLRFRIYKSKILVKNKF